MHRQARSDLKLNDNQSQFCKRPLRNNSQVPTSSCPFERRMCLQLKFHGCAGEIDDQGDCNAKIPPWPAECPPPPGFFPLGIAPAGQPMLSRIILSLINCCYFFKIFPCEYLTYKKEHQLLFFNILISLFWSCILTRPKALILYQSGTKFWKHLYLLRRGLENADSLLKKYLEKDHSIIKLLS